MVTYFYSDLDARRRHLQRLLHIDYPALEAEFCNVLGIREALLPPEMRGENLVQIILDREFPSRPPDED